MQTCRAKASAKRIHGPATTERHPRPVRVHSRRDICGHRPDRSHSPSVCDGVRLCFHRARKKRFVGGNFMEEYQNGGYVSPHPHPHVPACRNTVTFLRHQIICLSCSQTQPLMPYFTLIPSYPQPPQDARCGHRPHMLPLTI